MFPTTVNVMFCIFNSFNSGADDNGAQFQHGPFGRDAHVAQATTPLRISDIAGALAGLHVPRHRLNHGALTCLGQFGTNRAWCVPETVADGDIIILRVLLVNGDTQVCFAQRLLAIKGEIDRPAILCAAESVAAGPDIVQVDTVGKWICTVATVSLFLFVHWTRCHNSCSAGTGYCPCRRLCGPSYLAGQPGRTDRNLIQHMLNSQWMVSCV